MTMTSKRIACIALIVLQVPLLADKLSLGVMDINATKALKNAMRQSGDTNSMQRVVQAMNSEMEVALQNTRKFELYTRNDLESVMKEQDLTQSGLVDADGPNAAQLGKLRGVQYILNLEVNDFQDYTEEATFSNIGQTVTKRKIRLSTVAKIIDTSTGRIKETVSYQLSNEDITEKKDFAKDGGKQFSDSLLVSMSKMMSQKAAQRIVNVLYPIRVLAIAGNQITINRGDRSGIKVGETYQVFALGEEMIDPDTGESLGANEISVGAVKINRINPKFSNATIIENYGIEKKHILRKSNQ